MNKGKLAEMFGIETFEDEKQKLESKVKDLESYVQDLEHSVDILKRSNDILARDAMVNEELVKELQDQLETVQADPKVYAEKIIQIEREKYIKEHEDDMAHKWYAIGRLDMCHEWGAKRLDAIEKGGYLALMEDGTPVVVTAALQDVVAEEKVEPVADDEIVIDDLLEAGV